MKKLNNKEIEEDKKEEDYGGACSAYDFKTGKCTIRDKYCDFCYTKDFKF